MAKTDSAYLASQQVFGFSMADERSTERNTREVLTLAVGSKFREIQLR